MLAPITVNIRKAFMMDEASVDICGETLKIICCCTAFIYYDFKRPRDPQSSAFISLPLMALRVFMSIGVRVKARVYICGLIGSQFHQPRVIWTHLMFGSVTTFKSPGVPDALPKHDALVHDLHLTAYHGGNISLITHTYQ